MSNIKQTKTTNIYQTASIQYIFMDIVGYSRNRSVEAQTDILAHLNKIVIRAVKSLVKTPNGIIFIPTGDGICVALMGGAPSFDLHIRISIRILELIDAYNARQSDVSRKFMIRVGINENTDNLIEDINGRKNISGAGINIAQRLMDLADGGNIIVGRAVYERLSQREQFIKSFKKFHTHIKHDVPLDVYQFLDRRLKFLNCDTPTAFKAASRVKVKVTEFVAYLLAQTAKNKEFIAQHVGGGQNNYALRMLMIFLAEDSLGHSQSTAFDPYRSKRPAGAAGSIAAEYKYFLGLHFWVCCDYVGLFTEAKLKGYGHLFKNDFLVVSKEGLRQLRRQFPKIAHEFGLAKITIMVSG